MSVVPWHAADCPIQNCSMEYSRALYGQDADRCKGCEYGDCVCDCDDA
jgi:hypothetical protein